MSELPDRFPRGWFVLGHKEILRQRVQKLSTHLIENY